MKSRILFDFIDVSYDSFSEPSRNVSSSNLVFGIFIKTTFWLTVLLHARGTALRTTASVGLRKPDLMKELLQLLASHLFGDPGIIVRTSALC